MELCFYQVLFSYFILFLTAYQKKIYDNEKELLTLRLRESQILSGKATKRTKKILSQN